VRNQSSGTGLAQLTNPASAKGILASPEGSVLWAGSPEQGVMKLDINAKQARDRAEAIFKKKEERLREGQIAMGEYVAARLATREKTARLRALRLARDLARKTLPAQKQSI
jgi:hypothetical protein